MRRFAFTLQALANVKQTLKKKQERELAAANARVRALTQALEALQQEYRTKSEEFEAWVAGGGDPERLKQYDHYFTYLRECIRAAEKDLAQATQERLEKQKILMTTMAEIKALERLRETQYKEYLMELQKESDKEMDDFVSFQQSHQQH